LTLHATATATTPLNTVKQNGAVVLLLNAGNFCGLSKILAVSFSRLENLLLIGAGPINHAASFIAGQSWKAAATCQANCQNQRSCSHSSLMSLTLHATALAAAAKGSLIISCNRITCVGDHLPPRAAGMPRSSNAVAMARNDSKPAACSSLIVGARSIALACAFAFMAAVPAARAFFVIR